MKSLTILFVLVCSGCKMHNPVLLEERIEVLEGKVESLKTLHDLHARMLASNKELWITHKDQHAVLHSLIQSIIERKPSQ